MLGPQYLNLTLGKIEYMNLDFTLFCAGQMEIISSSEIPEVEILDHSTTGRP